MPAIEFWYSIGSTYTYLTVSRLRGYAERHGVEFDWKPFDVRAIMVEQKNVPFADKPVKFAYMWRDLERRAQLYDLPVTLPAPYPIENLALANQVALLGMGEGWGIGYTVETYRRWFVRGEPAGSEPNLSATLTALGLDAPDVIARANAPEAAKALQNQTAEGRDRGVFGAPTFIVGDEVFWGDDRLDDAVAWARAGQLSPKQA